MADKEKAKAKAKAAKAEADDGTEEDTDAEVDEEEVQYDEPAGPGDPALEDPQEAAEARVGGRTSDPASREEGVTASEVPPDVSEGAKASDAGSEAYPFPPGGDVDVALLDDEAVEGEYDAPLQLDDWVVLDGSHELVPERLDGHIAYVTQAPTVKAPDVPSGPHAAQTSAPDAPITVKTRDEVNATLILPPDAFKRTGKGGRDVGHPA